MLWITPRDQLSTNHKLWITSREQLSTNHKLWITPRDQLSTNHELSITPRDQLSTNHELSITSRGQLSTNQLACNSPFRHFTVHCRTWTSLASVHTRSLAYVTYHTYSHVTHTSSHSITHNSSILLCYLEELFTLKAHILQSKYFRLFPLKPSKKLILAESDEMRKHSLEHILVWHMTHICGARVS